jgi:DNA repair exonuclease SbcCD ATPase subunit
MNEPEKIRCEEYSRALFGKSVKNNELEDLVKGSSSYDEFRVRVVHKFSNRNEYSKRIAGRWQSTIVVKTADHLPDANILLHMLEGIAQRQVEVERKMREANAELLERLQTLDAAATTQAIWRANLDEIRDQIGAIRKSLERLEELPSRGGNGSK